MLLKRLAFFGGKGGVGKSTLACATALRLSQEGKTLLVSIDPAHSISGIFGFPVGSQLKEVSKNLYAVELEGERLVEEYAKRVLEAISGLTPSVRRGLMAYAEYLRLSPTALETAMLDRLVDFIMEGYEYIMVDSAPTGQLIRLFKSLQAVRGWFELLRRVAKERQKVEAFMGREDRLLKIVEERRKRLEFLSEVLSKKGILFAVAREEPLSLEEASRLEKELKGYIEVRRVINCWRSMEGNFLKVEEVEKPYGLEGLKRISAAGLVDAIKRYLDGRPDEYPHVSS